METFKRLTDGFNFVYERNLAANETVILKMPTVSPNKRGVNDIGFLHEEGIELYGTLAADYKGENVLWQKIQPFDEVNKTTSYLKIVNTGGAPAKINIRALLN